MDFDRAQQVLETLQAQCPSPTVRDIEVWISAITRAREVLLELQLVEDQTITPKWPDPERAICAGLVSSE